MMKKTLALLLLLSLPAAAQPANLQADLDAMVAAERAFAKLGAEKGFKESFLAFIADDGIMFRPMPIQAKASLKERPEPPISLIWGPSHAEISRSGEMGWTTGPSEIRPKGSDEVIYGHFVTVWKKQPDGNWRWLIDTGIGHDKPASPASELPKTGPVGKAPEAGKSPTPKAPQADTAAEMQALLALDRELGQATAKGTSAAYLARVADDARLMRGGAFPYVGKEAVRAGLEKAPASMTSTPEGGGVSAAADLGYTYGTAEWQGAKVGYLRIWEKQGGTWKLAVDWVDDPPPVPSSKPPAKP
ncbi:MAG TPA: nuclear transport factor 2 family protein [Thermoanaerobaculia bacterium]|nr:nuclear transport factor 2 family protein [Thermoanaerobaculia bacterium]